MMSSPVMAVSAIELKPILAVRDTGAATMLATPEIAATRDPLNIALAVIAVVLFAVVIRRRGPTTTA